MFSRRGCQFRVIYAAEATDTDEHAGYYISEVCERPPVGRKTGLDHELHTARCGGGYR